MAGFVTTKNHKWFFAITLCFLFFGKTAFADINDWGPFLQTLTPNSVIVKWRVPASEDFNDSIHFGTSPGSLTTVVTDATAVTKSCSYCPEDWREYEVTLSLTADTRYYYAVGTSTTPSTETKLNGSFKTPPTPGTAKPIRIWAVGDSGTGDIRALVVGERFKNYTKDRDPDIWLMLGDNAYEDGDDRDHHDGVFLMYPEFLRNVSVWPTFGNHDAGSATSGSETGTYFDIWQLPRAAEAGGVASGTEAYYSFDYGNIHFIVLDSFGHPRVAPSSMITWLQSDLAANDKEWIIAYWHHPPYSRGSHNSNLEQILIEMRENIVPILESNGVDLVLSGHSHSYERSYFLNGHYGDQTTFNLGTHALDSGNGKSEPLHMADGAYTKALNPDGTKVGDDGAVYAVAGSSGQLSSVLIRHPAMYIPLNKLGSMVLDVYENRLEAIFIDSLGKIEDQFTITHDLNTFPPEMFSVYAPNPLTLEVQFSEPLEKVSAENSANYVLDNGATITAAELLDDYRTVRLLTSELSNTTTYNLTVTNVQDHESNTAIPAPGSQFSFTPSFVDPPVYSAHFQDGTYPHSGYNGTRDTYIFEGAPDTNYGTKAELIAHGRFENTIEGDALVLVSWDLSSIPSNATIQSATVYFDLFNRSETSYHLHEILTSWTETGATWNSLGGTTNVSSTIMGTITPQKFALNTIPLNAAGISVIQGWVDGSITNNGLAVQNAGPGEHPDWWNAIRFFSRQTDTRPRLSVTYTLPTGADSISPSIIAPPDVVVDSTGDQTSVSLGTAAAVDDIGVASITNDAPAGGFPLGTTIVIWTATDAAGNTGTDSQNVTVRVPTATSPNTISFQDGVEPSAFYFGTEDSTLTETSRHKNLGDDTELWGDGVSQDPDTGLFGELTFVTKWDLSAIPPNAVVSSVDVSFNVFNDSPVAHDIVEVEAGWTEDEVSWSIISHNTTVGSTIFGSIPPLTFNENIVSLNQAGIDLVQGWIDGTIPNNGFLIQTSGSNNGMGVHSSEAATATSRPKIAISYTIPAGTDTEPPVVTAPADITTPATGPLTPVDIGTATATDNVGVTSLTNNAPPGGFPAGATIVTWTAMDAAGNIGTDTQTITVVDDVLPTITAPADITMEATAPATPVSLGTPTTSDNVGVASVTNDAPAGGFPVGLTLVTWTVTDTSGNINTDTQNVTIEDTTAPVVTAPADITVTETGPLTPVDIGTATATDAVGVTSLTNDAPEDGFPQGTTIVTWTADDAAGNIGTDTQVIAVQAAGSGGPTTVSFQDGVEPDSSYAGTQDSLLRQSSPDTPRGDETSLSADLVQPDPTNGTFGEVISVISWDISSIPIDATVDSASISLELTNVSGGNYDLFEVLTSWNEATVTWNILGGSSTNVGTTAIGTISPGIFGENVITLNADGLNLLQGWIDGSINNNGIVVKQVNNNNDGIFINSSEAATGKPKLTVTYTTPVTGDTEPPVVTPPPDVTAVSTGSLTPVNIGTATATDNIGVVSLTNDAPAGGYPLGTTIVTWTALDAAANAGTATQQVIVQVPTVEGSNTTSFQNEVEPDILYLGTQDALLRETSPDVNDNTSELWADGVAPDPVNGLFGEVVSVISWDVTSIPSNATVTAVSITLDFFNDSSGNHDFLQANSTWTEDTVTWGNFGGTGSMGTTVLGTIGPFLFNEQEFSLGVDGVNLVQGWIDGTIPNNGIVVRSAGTNNGIGFDSSEATTGRPKLTVTYDITSSGDTTPPVVTAPADVTTEATGPTTTVALGTGTANDDVDGPLVPTNDAPPAGFPVGLTVVTWSATDSSGNTGTDTQNVTVTDTTPPTVTAPADITTTNTTPALGTGTATDLVDGSITPTNDSPGTFPVGTTVVTWSATDTAGNTGTDTQNVTITEDTTPPVVTAPADVTTEATGPTTTVALGTGTANDDVDGPLVPTNDAPPAGFPVGLTVVTWSATDSSGNTGTDTQNVTVTDTTPPTVTAPADITTTDTTPNLGTGTANDLVDGSITPTNDSPGTFPVGTTVVTWSATDTAGNTGTDTQNVTITEDTTPPVVTAPADVTTEATGPTTTVALGTGTANDDVDGPLVPTNDAPPAGFPVGLTVVTWSATDSSGNTGTDTQNVTVTDTTPPTVTAPADITTTNTTPALGTGTATDLVDGSITPTNDSPGTFPVGTTVVTWSATDTAGNTGTDTQNVTITEDTTPPVVTAPADVTTEATGPTTTVALGTGTANDDVDGPLVPTNDAPPAGFPVGLTVVTWSATDSSGNTGTDTQNVTVTDTTPPTVTAPADITTTNTTPNLGTGTANDLVDGSITPTNDSPGTFPVGTTVVTWSATDTAGNTGTDTQNVTITEDTTPPVVTAPADVTTEATGPTTTVALGTGTANDDVDGSLVPTNDAPAGGFPVGLTVVTWSATDSSGNTGTDTQNVTVTDTTPPTVTAPADITTTNTTPNLGTGTANDLVDGSITPTNDAPATFPVGTTVVTWSATDTAGNTGTDTQNVTITEDTTPPVVTAPADVTTEATGPTTTVALGTGTANDDVDGSLVPTNDAPAGGFPVGLTVVTWSATDSSGNTGTDTQNVTVTDTTPPTVTAPADITTTNTTPNLGTGTANDLVDGSITPTNDAPATFPVGTTVVTWSATDTAGNTGTDTQNVTIEVVGFFISFQDGVEPDPGYSGTQDAYLEETAPTVNNGTDVELWSDGRERDPVTRTFGELFSVISWDISSVPTNAIVQSVSITIDIFNSSPGQSFIYQSQTSWTEGTVNWNTFTGGSAIGTDVLGTVPIDALGENVIDLNQDGIDLVQGWIDGSISNEGIVIRGDGTINGMIFDSSEAATGMPKLTINYTLP